jgi:hypothetical protein
MCEVQDKFASVKPRNDKRNDRKAPAPEENSSRTKQRQLASKTTRGDMSSPAAAMPGMATDNYQRAALCVLPTAGSSP